VPGTRVAAFFAAGALAMALASCSTSPPQSNVVQGAQGNAGDVAVRGAAIVRGPSGASSATLVATLVNGGASADVLVSVSVASPKPSAISITGGQLYLPPNVAVGVGHTGEKYINFYGFDPTPSQIVSVTFRFRDHGSTTLNIKTVPPTGVYAGIAPVAASPSAS